MNSGVQEGVFKQYMVDSNYWLIDAGNKKCSRCSWEVLFLSFCNRCGWHSTKVVRDTLSYHPLSHQLNTQWKSCSTTSNTWTSERWLSVSPIFDISTRKTPGPQNETLNLGPISTLERGSEARWQVNSPPPDSGTPCQLIYQFLEGLLPLQKGEGGIYGLNQDFHNQVRSFSAQSDELFLISFSKYVNT